MKKILVFIIAFLIIGLAVVSAQTAEQQQELLRLMEEMSAGKITYYEFLQLYAEVLEPTEEANPQLVTATGRAWIIRDNEVQGSGKAIIFKTDGNYEYYERILGIWRPIYSAETYTANAGSVNLNNEGNINYTISNNGSTLTLTSYNSIVNGTYTLGESPRVVPPGGNILNPAGTAWDGGPTGNTGKGHDIYANDGIRYCFGGSGYSPFEFGENGNWFRYTANSSTGKLSRTYKNESRRPEELNYSVTDFGNGNKTLRMWNGYLDEVYKLVSTPSGFRLPNVR